MMRLSFDVIPGMCVSRPNAMMFMRINICDRRVTYKCNDETDTEGSLLMMIYVEENVQ